MEDWVKIAAQTHKLFEEKVKAKSYHKLDLSEYVKGEIIEETKETTQTDDGNNITQQLKDLNEMYKSGALTKEEFEKAKKKLLN